MGGPFAISAGSASYLSGYRDTSIGVGLIEVGVDFAALMHPQIAQITQIRVKAATC